MELSRSNAKLQVQADELRRQAEVLRKAEQRFRSVLEAAPDAMVVCREDGEIVMVNSQTEVLFKVQSRQLVVQQYPLLRACLGISAAPRLGG